VSFVGNALNNVPFVKTNVVKFTADGTYTPPANLRGVQIVVQGAGAGGSGAPVSPSNGMTCGSGGGPGSWGIVTLNASDLAGALTITVGLGGAGGVSDSSEPTAGGASVVTDGVTTWSAGGGGIPESFFTLAAGDYAMRRQGGRGTVTGPFDVVGAGKLGGPTVCMNRMTDARRVLTTGMSGGYFGGDGVQQGINVTGGGSGQSGAHGVAPGCGGSTGWHFQSTGVGARNGGNGADGIVIITEYLAEEA